ncbi:hypothetical protein Nepgr_001961 [Nepenthes gracilis]|uniref:Uncharacterized protein n=1 Tax=Nepenthes gracilis TaxID=150966 RepID=A0AAD3RWG0_NEPGR|nr:hypothetical protein Nepgr_001961 [Nepenthes gracilis]
MHLVVVAVPYTPTLLPLLADAPKVATAKACVTPRLAMQSPYCRVATCRPNTWINAGKPSSPTDAPSCCSVGVGFDKLLRLHRIWA